VPCTSLDTHNLNLYISIPTKAKMAATQDLGKMAGEVEAWFNTVTDVASGASSDIIAPIDFVSQTVLQSGSEREVARQATCTTAPRKDVIAAAIAAGQATVKHNRQTHADMSGSKVEDKKSLGSPTPPSLLQRMKNRFMPNHNLYVPQKPKAASVPAFIHYLRIGVLVVMVLSGIVLTHMTLVKLGQPSPMDKVHHHAKHLLHMVRGKHHNKHAKCEEWAAIGGCAKNPVFMHEMCRKSCYHAPHFDEVLVDTNSHCSEWAPQGECLNNPKFMMINCPKSCSELEKVHEQQRAEAEAQLDKKEAAFALEAVAAQPQGEDKSEYCPHWAMKGECAANPSFMAKECPKSCASAQVAPAP
jgi:hypothetical protein